MEVKELKKIIDSLDIRVLENDAYLVIAKVDNEASISFEGERNVMLDTVVQLMQEYKDFASLLCEASDLYLNNEL